MSDYTNKSAGSISTFANKARELRLSVELCASQYGSTSKLLKKVLSRCDDLPILASELGLESEELLAVKAMHDGMLTEAAEMLAVAQVCERKLEELAARMARDYAPYSAREVVTPLSGIYTASPKQHKMAAAVARRHRVARVHAFSEGVEE